jgi:hypothetical protein
VEDYPTPQKPREEGGVKPPSPKQQPKTALSLSRKKELLSLPRRGSPRIALYMYNALFFCFFFYKKKNLLIIFYLYNC